MKDFAAPFRKNALASIRDSHSLTKAQTAYLSGQVYEMYDRYREASTNYLTAVENDRSNVEYRYRAANVLWQLGDLKEARKQLVSAKALDTQNARAKDLIQKLDRQTQRELYEKSPMMTSGDLPDPLNSPQTSDPITSETSSKSESLIAPAAD
jgi:tetratricopeptide (TPR) repeat protein